MYAEEIGNENLGLIPLFNNNKKNSYTIILLKQRNISSQLLKFSKCNCEGLLNHYSAKKNNVGSKMLLGYITYQHTIYLITKVGQNNTPLKQVYRFTSH